MTGALPERSPLMHKATRSTLLTKKAAWWRVTLHLLACGDWGDLTARQEWEEIFHIWPHFLPSSHPPLIHMGDA